MNKLEHIQTLKDSADLSKSQAAAVVDILLMEWPTSLPMEFGWRSRNCAHFS